MDSAFKEIIRDKRSGEGYDFPYAKIVRQNIINQSDIDYFRDVIEGKSEELADVATILLEELIRLRTTSRMI